MTADKRRYVYSNYSLKTLTERTLIAPKCIGEKGLLDPCSIPPLMLVSSQNQLPGAPFNTKLFQPTILNVIRKISQHMKDRLHAICFTDTSILNPFFIPPLRIVSSQKKLPRVPFNTTLF